MSAPVLNLLVLRSTYRRLGALVCNPFELAFSPTCSTRNMIDAQWSGLVPWQVGTHSYSTNTVPRVSFHDLDLTREDNHPGKSLALLSSVP